MRAWPRRPTVRRRALSNGCFCLGHVKFYFKCPLPSDSNPRFHVKISLFLFPNVSYRRTVGMASVLPPFDVILSWPPPNHVNPPSRATLLLAIEIPLLIITVFVVALRLASRWFLSAG